MLSPELTVAGTAYHYTPGSPAYQWVSDTIDQARNAGIRWIIVGYHYPCLTGGKYECASGSDLFNLLVAKHVDLVLNGHEHNYQRSKQIGLDAVACPSIAATGYNPGCVTDDGLDGVYPKDAGTVEIVAGTFGRGLYSVSRTDPEAPYMVSMNGTTHGFVQYTVTADRIDASFVRSEGTFSDSFSIVQGAPAIADHTPPTTPATVSADTSTPGTVRLSWAPEHGRRRHRILLGAQRRDGHRHDDRHDVHGRACLAGIDEHLHGRRVRRRRATPRPRRRASS